MAVTNQKSTQYSQAYDVTQAARTPLHSWENGGRVRIMYFEFTQDGAGDATSDIKLCKLPAGSKRVLGRMSSIYVNTTTSSATLDIGWDAYTGIDGVTVAADPNGIDDGIDTDAAGFFNLGSALTATGGTKVFTSSDGVTLMATSQDVALADGDTISGYICYVGD